MRARAHTQGRTYRPAVVRVGSDVAPLSERARDVWVDGLIAKLLSLSEPDWRRKYERHHAEVGALSRQVLAAQAAVSDASSPVSALDPVSCLCCLRVGPCRRTWT